MSHHAFAEHLHCFSFSGSMDCLKKEFCRQQSHVLALASIDTGGGVLRCGYLSSCQDGWAHITALFFGVPDGHSNQLPCWLGEGIPGGQSSSIPILQLKSWDTVCLSNLRQSKKAVARLGSALRSQPQTDGQASSTTVLSLWTFSNGEA